MITTLKYGQFGVVLCLLAVAITDRGVAAAVFPIANDASRVEFGLSAAFDGTHYLVGIQGDGVAHDSVTAQLIAADGTLVGPRIATGEAGGVPRVAFDGANYFMIWDGTDLRPGLYGQFVDPAGQLVGSLLTIGTTPDARDYSLAYGGGQYLACWSNGDAVYGRIVTPAGTFAGAGFIISGTTERARDHAVAFDGTNFLVVFNGTGDYRSNVYGQFVNQGGSLVGGTFLIDDSPDPSDNPPAVVFGGTTYLVVFNDETGGYNTGAWDIYGRLVSPSGSVLPDRLAIAVDAGAQRFPFAAFDGANYLVSWSHAFATPESDAVFRFFSPAGQPVSAAFSAFAAQGANRPLLGAAWFDGNRYLAVATLGVVDADFNFTAGDVYGTFLSRSPAQLVADYRFQDSLASSIDGAPELAFLGAEPVYLDELFPSGNQRVLRFLAGEGLELAGFTQLVGTSYTLVAVFRFDETSSWRRIFDFKNRTSDWGLYGYYGKLNFYNIITGPEELVKQAEYIEVALSRDAQGVVRGYVDGSRQIEFNDSSGHALPNLDDLLVLFRDDLVVRNEHTSGRINSLRIYDRALSDDEIRAGVAELDVRFGGGSKELADDWRQSLWFGLYNEARYPWIHSPLLGWVRVWLRQDGSFWFYLPSLGFIWSNEALFPYVYHRADAVWMRFDPEASGNHWMVLQPAGG
jgi:hypothetical protein